MAYFAFRRFVLFLLSFIVAVQALADTPQANKALVTAKSFDLQACEKKADCTFFIMGAGFKNPKMALNIPRDIWNRLADADKEKIEASLKEHMANARKNSNLYTTRFAHIPPTAPAFAYMSSNVATTDGYTVYLADKKHPERGEWLTGSELFTKKF